MPRDTTPSEGCDARSRAELRRRIEGTSVNPTTFLSTDYLNHFNEIVMILEMLPDMPECIEEVLAWRPKSYCEHFRDSAFADREVAIAAYAHVPPEYRVPFEAAVRQANGLIEANRERLRAAAESGDRTQIEDIVTPLCRTLHDVMSNLRGIVNGTVEPLDQESIDRLIEG